MCASPPLHASVSSTKFLPNATTYSSQSPQSSRLPRRHTSSITSFPSSSRSSRRAARTGRATRLATAKDQTDAEMWKERGARMCLVIASQLAEMKDFTAAASLLEPLYKTSSSPVLLSAIARIYLQAGNLYSATRVFERVAANPDTEPSLKLSNSAMLASANGDWRASTELYAQLMLKDRDDIIAINNYAVALLSQGRLKEGIHVLETALQASPSAITTTEPYLFNLSTLYELRSGLAAHKKRDLLIEVAKWSGDGVRPACLKLPAA